MGRHTLLQGIFKTEGLNLGRWEKPYNAMEKAWHYDSDAAAAAKSLQSRPTLRDLQPTRLLCPWDFPGKSTGVGCHCLLQDSDEQGPNPGFLVVAHLSDIGCKSGSKLRSLLGMLVQWQSNA